MALPCPKGDICQESGAESNDDGVPIFYARCAKPKLETHMGEWYRKDKDGQIQKVKLSQQGHLIPLDVDGMGN